jgi:predicted RNase H-like nuclease (RuvC/YqgF family)
VWWQAVASIAGLASALTAFGLGVAAFVRSGRAEDARERADAAGVGLKYLERSLAAQQDTITRQEGEIGELRGRLRECREERQAMAVKIRELEERMA